MTIRQKLLKKLYRLAEDEWNLIEAFQNKVCFICRKPNKSGNRLSTDHSHTTGLIRGLLCSSCNRVLGKIEDPRFWRDNLIARLERLLEYLKHPPAVEALGKEIYTFPGKFNTKRHRDWLKKNLDTIGTSFETI